MAKVNENNFSPRSENKHLRTSIGRGPNSRPTNKSKRRSWKRYRGQGK